MKTLYVYDNMLLGENGTDFNDESCVDSINCDTVEECLAKFATDYSTNDYTASFRRHN